MRKAITLWANNAAQLDVNIKNKISQKLVFYKYQCKFDKSHSNLKEAL